MQIAPINNTNFNGKFKNTKTLKGLLMISDKESVGRFNEIVKRANKINDGCIYELTDELIKNPIYRNYNVRFSLYKNNEQEHNQTLEKKVSRKIHSYDTYFERMYTCSDVLKQMLPIIEARYPKTDFDKS